MNKRRHPLEKSLAVFPLVPRSKANLISDSFDPRIINKRNRGDQTSYQRVEIRFDENSTYNKKRQKKDCEVTFE